MTLPRRLMDEGTLFEREILASAQLDAGSDASMRRALAAIGAASVVSTASVGAAGAVARWAAVKWVGLALVLATGTTGAAWWAVPRSESRSPAPLGAPESKGAYAVPAALAETSSRTSSPLDVSSAAAAPAPAAVSAPLRSRPLASGASRALSASLAAREIDAPTSGSAGAGTSFAPLATPSAIAPSPNPSHIPSTLRAEIAALEQARTALRRNPAEAIHRLDQFDRTYPDSSFASEAEVLRVDALAAQGRRAEAAALGRRLLAASPGTPYTAHVHAAIDTAAPEVP